jgi:hypothetical protein
VTRTRLATAARLALVELTRRRIVLLLLLLVPAVFYSVILLITTTRSISFQLSAVEQEDYLFVPQRDEALVFIGLAAVGLLTAFLGMNLAQRDAEVSRRLVLCGYRPWELIASRLGVLLLVVLSVSLVVTAVLPLFFAPQRLAATYFGFALCGWVYGCYGLLIGALFRHELEGTLFVALLANLDVGWLQNPIYYAHAQRQAIIRSLPGYFPSQVAMAAAFSEHALSALVWPALSAFAYGLALLLLALVPYGWRMRRRVTSSQQEATP